MAKRSGRSAHRLRRLGPWGLLLPALFNMHCAAVPPSEPPPREGVRLVLFEGPQLFWADGVGRTLPGVSSADPVSSEDPASAGTSTSEVPADPSRSPHPIVLPQPRSARDSSGPSRLLVLPVFLEGYRESRPCDSCHRLSQAGFEFALEHYLLERFSKRLVARPGNQSVTVTALSPSSGLIALPAEADTAALERLRRRLQTLAWPESLWFGRGGDTFIVRAFRPIPPLARPLDSLGGRFGASHLLVPFSGVVELQPKRGDRPVGGLRFSFYLALWNVERSRPEWAIAVGYSQKSTDLDQPLEPIWDGQIERVLDAVPGLLEAYRQAEPR